MMVEIIVAASIIVISVLAAMAVTAKSIAFSHRAVHSAQATFLLEEGAEATRIFRDNAWSNISGLTVGINYYPVYSGGTWTFPTEVSTVGIFTRTMTIANVNRDNTTADIVSSGGTLDAGTKLITITVSWLEHGVTVTKTLQFYLADIFS